MNQRVGVYQSERSISTLHSPEKKFSSKFLWWSLFSHKCDVNLWAKVFQDFCSWKHFQVRTVFAFDNITLFLCAGITLNCAQLKAM